MAVWKAIEVLIAEKSWPLEGGEAKPQAWFMSTAMAKGCLTTQVIWASGLFFVALGFRGSGQVVQAQFVLVSFMSN